MRLSNFKFKLPEEQVAQFPSRFRDEARMLVLHAKTGEIEHKCVSDLATYFEEGDIIVANDTKVFPARLYAKKEKTMNRVPFGIHVQKCSILEVYIRFSFSFLILYFWCCSGVKSKTVY